MAALRSPVVRRLLRGALLTATLLGAPGILFGATLPGAPSAVVTTFGALTLAGAGGIAVTGTAIASGDPSGHWAISGGFIAPSAAGDAANLSGGPYSLVLDNGQEVSIFVESNCWDVRTSAEWTAVITQSAATLSGKKIAIRPGQMIMTGVDGSAARLRRNDYGGLEICCRPVGVLADVDGFTLRGTRNVTFRRLRTDAAPATKFLMIGETANHLENIVIDDCHVRGAPGDPNGDYSISTNFPMNGIDLITTQGSAMLSVGNITVTNNLVEWCGTGIGLRVDKAGAQYVVGGNIVRYFYDDAIGLSMATGGAVPRPAAVTDNLLYANIGRSTDSANPHTDAIRFIGQIDATGDWPVVIDRNIIFVGNSRGDGHLQGVLASDFKTVSGDSGMFFTGQAIGNVIISDTTQALSIENAKDFFAANNTVVGSKTSGGLYTARISIGAGSTYSTTSGTHVLERNIAEAYDVGGAPTLTDNLTVGKGGATIPFASLFDGPSWYPNSRAEALSWFARKVGGPADIGGTYDIGAIASGAVVFPTTSPGNDGSNNVSPPIAPSAAITLTRSHHGYGASSMQGGQQVGNPVGGTQDIFTKTALFIDPALTYDPGAANRPVAYVMTNGHRIRNRGQGGTTAAQIVAAMTADMANVAANDMVWLHQGDNAISGSTLNASETLLTAFADMRTLAGARPFVQIVNTRGGRNFATTSNSPEPPGSFLPLVKDIVYRSLNDSTPGRVVDFHHTLMELNSTADANDLADIGLGSPPRSHMMTDGSHQINVGYDLQSDEITRPIIDAVEGGTPFAVRQIIEAVSPAVPAAGDVIGSLVAYGSGGTWSLDASNTQADYGVNAAGQFTRIGAVRPSRDIVWATVKASKPGRFDRVSKRIGLCERAAPGESRLVQFDGASIIGSNESKMANSSRMTLIMRLQAVDQSVIQMVLGLNASQGAQIRLLTGGTLDINWRNAAGTIIVSKTTSALFRTTDAPRWVALSLDLSNPAAEVTELVHWAVPATAVQDVAVHANLTADTTTAHLARLALPMAIGHNTIGVSTGNPAAFGKFRFGDFYIFNEYLDFKTQARRELISDAAGAPLASWVSGGGVIDGFIPLLGLRGRAGDLRQCRTIGSANQKMGFNQIRRADGEAGYLVTV